MANEKRPSVFGTMQRILFRLNDPEEKKNLPGKLAIIRRTLGKEYEQASEAWPILIPLMPEEFVGSYQAGFEEKALLTALQMYAIGQQGSKKVNDRERCSFGESLREIKEEKSDSLDMRFNAMITARTFEEFTYHIRQLFKIGKTVSGFSVSYAGLAEDLFYYQAGCDRKVALRWAKGYYRPITEEDREKFKARREEQANSTNNSLNI